MRGFYRRYLVVVGRFLPFALAFLRDRRRFLLFGPPRHLGERAHRERAQEITQTMLDLGPAFIKVGQVLSTRPDIVPPIYAEEFASLQDEVPEGAGGDPKTVVEEELGHDLDLSTMEPIAGGSLAFVYTVDHQGEQIALKVRRPGIQPIIERDLEVIRQLIPIVGVFADERQQYSLRNAADDFEQIITEELDFDREASMMVEIRDNLADDDRVVVPEVYEDLSSERLLAMEYVTGRKITDDDAFAGVDVEASDMATKIARTYLQMGLIDGVFHGDPHPGNLAVNEDGQLVIYDFGMSQRLPQQVREDILGLYRALARRDVDELTTTLIALDVLDPAVDRTAVRNVLRLVIENLEGRSEITWRMIITELMTMLHDFPFRIPPDVMLLIRVGTVGEGVCRQLDSDFDFLAVIRSFLVDHGFIESEIQAALEEMREDLQMSIPAAARAPARFDRVFGQLERGELVVKTDPVDSTPAGDPAVGYAVLAAALLVASSVFVFHERPYEVVSLAFAAAFFVLYLYRRRVRR